MDELPSLSFTKPYKERYISGSSNSSIKFLSLLLTNISTVLKENLQTYCTTKREMWCKLKGLLVSTFRFIRYSQNQEHQKARGLIKTRKCSYLVVSHPKLTWTILIIHVYTSTLKLIWKRCRSSSLTISLKCFEIRSSNILLEYPWVQMCSFISLPVFVFLWGKF